MNCAPDTGQAERTEHHDLVVIALEDAVALFEGDEECQKVGTDAWAWLQNAQDLLHPEWKGSDMGDAGAAPRATDRMPETFASGQRPTNKVMASGIVEFNKDYTEVKSIAIEQRPDTGHAERQAAHIAHLEKEVRRLEELVARYQDAMIDNGLE